MVDYDDITHTLLIDQIKIQYDSSSEWHKYLKSSLRNPHSFVYPDKQSYSDIYRSREIDFINSSCLSKGYKIKHIDKLTHEQNDENDKERYLFEIEKDSEKHLNEDSDALMRKIVYLFKDSMQYYMSFSENDDLYGDKNIRKRDIKYNSDYELLKGLNDCIVNLHDSKDNNFQAMIMTNDFCGLFSPNYIRLTKYTDSFKVFLKENHIHYFDLFDEEIKNNELYKKKKQYFDYLKSSAYMPLTKGEISLAGKKKIVHNEFVKSECKEEKKPDIKKASLKNKRDLLRDTDDLSTMDEEKSKEKETNKQKKKKTTHENENTNTDEENEHNEENGENDKENEETENDQDISCQEKKRKRHEDKKEKKKKKKKKKKMKEKEKARLNANTDTNTDTNADTNADTNTDADADVDANTDTDTLEKPTLCLEYTKPEEQTVEETIKKQFNITSEENEEVLNYLNIKKEKDGISKQDLITGDLKIFNLLNKKINSDEYIYREIKEDFMKEINLPNNFNYEVHMIQIHEKCVKNFYRSVVKHINKKKEKIRVYHIISNFLFFYSKMYKTYINFDDNIHKDINKNFDYKSITIQGSILPYNFFLFLKGLILMSSFNLINTFYINISYDERKNKCLHFLNITENKFYENFKRFEHNIKAKFLYIHKFLYNIVPVRKYLISKGKLHRNIDSISFFHETNDMLQLTYNQQNDNNEIILYEDKDDINNVTNGVSGSAILGVEGSNRRNVNKNPFLGNNLYALYVSNSIKLKGINNSKNCFKILNDKDAITIIKDVLDINDNMTKNLLLEKKVLFLIDFYEKNLVYQYLLFNTNFFGTYTSMIYLFYVNTFIKSSLKVKDIPLFKPSCYSELVEHIIKKKREKELKKKKVVNLHTVDKLCNKFFKESFNKILNTNIKEGYSENLMNKLKNEEDIKETLHNLNVQANLEAQQTEHGVSTAIEDKNSFAVSPELSQEVSKEIVQEREKGNDNNGISISNNTGISNNDNINNNGINNNDSINDNNVAEVGSTISGITEIETNNIEPVNRTNENDVPKTTTELMEPSLIINEAVIRKKEYSRLVICIFVFINANAIIFSEEEKEIRELSLNVLKSKENKIEKGVKYVHKYRNNITDAVTLAELELRKNDETCQIHIIGLTLCNDICNHTLQRNIKQLYDLNKILHAKYPSNKIEITTNVFTYYWIFDVYTYGTIFLKDKEKLHLLKETTDAAYELPYVMQWKDKPLWGYHLFIVKDCIKSKYTEEMLEMLSEEGVRVTLCQECFEVQIFEDELNKVLKLHDLDIHDLKYMDQNIYLNTLFLVENGHLVYFALMDTDNIKMKQKYNSLNIQIFNSQVTFPSFHTGTPILNDSWLMEVLEKNMLVPYENHYYKY